MGQQGNINDQVAQLLVGASARSLATPKEFDLLMALASRPGELIRREELLSDLWGLSEGISTRTFGSGRT